MQGKATTFGKHGRAQYLVNHSSGGVSVAALCWLGFPQWLRDKPSACDARDTSLTSGSGWSPGEGNGNPLQDSCLDNPMDRGVWWTIVCRVTKSWTWLRDQTTIQVREFAGIIRRADDARKVMFFNFTELFWWWLKWHMLFSDSLKRIISVNYI